MRSSFALPIDLSVKSDEIASTRRSVFQGFSNAMKRLNKTTENAMKRLFKKEASVQGRLIQTKAKTSSVQERLVQVNSNASQSMRSLLGFSNIANRLNTTTIETSAETLKSASLSQTFQTNAEAKASLNVEFASAKFAPPPF
ncbi:MAG: hypothetical protein LBO72_05765 [Helicobacteraceae bacterium]|jgi:hypothetical protein|nr:hypothetical protein [Helicobacteraceae bacterium]